MLDSGLVDQNGIIRASLYLEVVIVVGRALVQVFDNQIVDAITKF